MFLNFRGRMTQIAVDWQVHAGDGRYYDVIFVGTGEFGSNQDAFITWRLNNLESILRFFFPSSALRFFLCQDMWGKIFDRKCVINFPL